MNWEFVDLNQFESDVAVITLKRPKANAICQEMLDELSEILDQLHKEPPRVIIVWGGNKIFAAGADITKFNGPTQAKHIGSLFHKTLDKLANFPRPTIAAIAGYALGGGCELALACDFRVCASEAKIGQPEILLGIIPGGGGTQRLPRLIGTSRAKELIFSGRQVDANEAFSIGLVDKIAKSGENVFDAAMNWASELSKGPTLAIALAKRAIDQGVETNIHAGLNLELELFTESFTSNDAKSGIESFLKNGPGKATFTGT